MYITWLDGLFKVLPKVYLKVCRKVLLQSVTSKKSVNCTFDCTARQNPYTQKWPTFSKFIGAFGTKCRRILQTHVVSKLNPIIAFESIK